MITLQGVSKTYSKSKARALDSHAAFTLKEKTAPWNLYSSSL